LTTPTGFLKRPPMRLGLAFRAFFAALYGRTLPPEVLPSEARASGQLPAGPSPETPAKPSRAEASIEAPAQPESAAPEPGSAASGPEPEAAAVQTLGVFQREGRFVDFLMEDLDGFSDAEIGATVREVHRGCRKALQEHFDLGPVRTEDEQTLVDVETGYDPARIRLTGNVSGSPPFSGVLKHKGWEATDVRLPRARRGDRVVSPAEVEVS
jgi:hypothetical protein